MDELRDTKDVGELTQYIVINLGEEMYGINIKYIDNIVRMQQITRLPKVEEYLKGVINIRGEIVPVMSIRMMMGMPQDEMTNKSRIIILKVGDNELCGIIVDQVNQVLTLDADSIEQVRYDNKDKSASNSFISGVGKFDGGLVSILDLTSLDLESKDK